LIEDPALHVWRHIDLHQHEVAAADDNSTMIHDLPDEIMGLCHSYLGVGHFGFTDPVCKKFKEVYLATNVSINNKFTNGESVFSSI